MKRFFTLFMVLGLMFGSVATAEAKRSRKSNRIERTVVGSYGPYPAPVTGCNEPLGLYACLVVDTRASETSLTAKVTDLHGQPVFVEVAVSGGGTVGSFCGETTRPITFESGSTLFFYLGVPGWPGNLMLDCPANRIKTTGTISVTLSDLR